MKLECPRQIFEKSSNIKFHENPYSGNRIGPCGRTYRHKWRSWLSLFAILRTRLKRVSSWMLFLCLSTVRSFIVGRYIAREVKYVSRKGVVFCLSEDVLLRKRGHTAATVHDLLSAPMSSSLHVSIIRQWKQKSALVHGHRAGLKMR
jgi:hypothetical protein